MVKSPLQAALGLIFGAAVVGAASYHSHYKRAAFHRWSRWETVKHTVVDVWPLMVGSVVALSFLIYRLRELLALSSHN